MNDYEKACREYATQQGLDPITERLTREGIRWELEQTGGWCMVVDIPLPMDGTSLQIVNGEPYGEQDETWSIGRYDENREEGCHEVGVMNPDYAVRLIRIMTESVSIRTWKLNKRGGPIPLAAGPSSVEDAKAFLMAYEAHPDDSAKNVIRYSDGKAIYTKKQRKAVDTYMHNLFVRCAEWSVDPYALSMADPTVDSDYRSIDKRPATDEGRISEATGRADRAFWASVVRSYPTAVSGDLDPGMVYAFETVQRQAVEAWVEVNVPGAMND